MKNYFNHYALLSLFLFVLASCEKNEDVRHGNKDGKEVGFASNDMVLYWNSKVATVLGAPMNQPTRTRLFAMTQIAVHDALNSIKPKYQRYVLLNAREQFASPDAAVASAAYWTIIGLNRQGSFPLDTWYKESLATVEDGTAKELGKTLGKQAAEAIVTNRTNDGFSLVKQADVNPPDGTLPGEYRHTNLMNLRYVPNWGTVVKPFVLTSNYQFRSTPPNPVTSAEYAIDYNEVKAKGARVGSTRTAEEEKLAKFWAENRPSIIWNDFTRAAIANKKMDAWKTARLFALMHTTMADGINTVLESAYHHYFWRPETAIHEGDNDNNPATTADASWIPFVVEVPSAIPAGYFVSPPVPEHPSAFALYGGATAAILQSVLQTDQVSINLTSASLPGTTMNYTSIAQAARDNSLAKIYTGWQFRKSIMVGEELGRQIAGYIINNHFKEQ